MPKHRILVINLDRSPERLAQMTAQLDALDLTFERVPAIDGREMTEAAIEAAAPAARVARRYHRALSPAEVACALSHRQAWQQIADADLDYGIVLEDDLQLQSNFTAALALIDSLPVDEWDFIKLFPLRRGGDSNVLDRCAYRGHSLITYRRFPLGFQAQAISRRGARAMLTNLRYVTEPADSQLKSWWEAGVYPIGLTPYCVTTDVGGDSDINPDGALESLPQNRRVKLISKAQRTLQRLWHTPRLRRAFRRLCAQLPTDPAS